jgi:hypothetical protein
MYEIYNTLTGRATSSSVYYTEDQAWEYLSYTRDKVSGGKYRQDLAGKVEHYSVRLRDQTVTY